MARRTAGFIAWPWVPRVYDKVDLFSCYTCARGDGRRVSDSFPRFRHDRPLVITWICFVKNYFSTFDKIDKLDLDPKDLFPLLLQLITFRS